MADTQVERNDAAMDTMAQEGRVTDDVMAHLTTGEIVIPLPIVESVQAQQMLRMMFELSGHDIEEFVVGSPKNKINPETGHPEFWGWKSIVNAVTQPINTAKDVIKDGVKTGINVAKDVVSIPVNTTKDLLSTGVQVTKDMIKGDIGGAIKDTGAGITDIGNDVGNGLVNAGKDTVAGVKQGVKDAYTGIVKESANLLDVVGLLPKAPAVQQGGQTSPSTITQGDGQNQRQQAVTDVVAAAGGGSSSLTPRTVAGPDNDYKLNKSAVLGL